MNDIITIDGVKYQRMEEEPAVKEPKKSPFECENGDKYYYTTSTGGVGEYHWGFDAIDKDLAKVANYCKDEKLMRQRALHEILNRLLWKASVEAGELDNDWMGCGYEHKHWHIEMYTNNEEFGVDYFLDTKYCDGIYFPTEQSALDAIENIVKPFMTEHPDFVW